MCTNFGNDLNNHIFNQEEIFELISDLIPGFNHKLSNFLMKISGQATLLQRYAQYNEADQSSWDFSLPELCDQFSQLMNKWLTLARSTDKSSSRCAVLDCLVVSLSRFQHKKPQRTVLLDNQLTEKDYIWSDFMRLQRCIYYLLLCMDSLCPSPQSGIDIRATGTISPVASTAFTPRRPLNYIKIDFSIQDWSGDSPGIDANDFYSPDKPLTFQSCCLAAAEAILHNYYGHLAIQENAGFQITAHIPQMKGDHAREEISEGEDDSHGNDIFYQRQALSTHYEWRKSGPIKSD